MKKLIITILLLSHSFLAMAEDNSTKVELLNFIKENNIIVGSYHHTVSSSGVFNNNNLTIDDLGNIDLVAFKDKNINTIPSTLSTLPNLVEIYIDNVNLNSFPKLDNFTILKLSNIDFDKIANDVFENRRLTELFIVDSKVTSLPSSIGNLTNLIKLELENNQLEELPKEFENLVNLKYLKLDDNKIEELPNTLSKLIHLSIKNSSLKKLPDNFGNNINLQYLDLSNNELKELPDSFVNLTNLRDLYLNNNKLDKLPKGVFKLFKNKHYEYYLIRYGANLDISNNRLSFLDSSICDGFMFSYIYFDNNYFDKLPNCLNDINETFTIEVFNSNLLSLEYIYSTKTIKGEPLSDYFDKGTNYFLQQAGWQFAEDIIIYYTYENDKTIKFEPIYQIDINIESYLWNFGDGNTSIEEIATHTYQDYGEYNVTLTINSDKTFSKLITISPRTLELKKGWNMITPPTKDDINASLFSETWSYQNEKWENSHSYLIPTLGYWVKLNEDLNYSYNGEVYKLPNYKIKSGWNFVGSGEKYTKKENETIYQYKNSEWRVNPNEIKRGEGFWVKKQ